MQINEDGHQWNDKNLDIDQEKPILQEKHEFASFTLNIFKTIYSATFHQRLLGLGLKV